FLVETVPLDAGSFVFSILLSLILAYILGKFYVRKGRNLSNKRILANVFPLLSITTCIVIAVVKSSLALSLGLVGALSIVRFRTPIKEPEELVYIFLSIAIGLANGADQYLAAIIGLTLAMLSLYITNINYRKTENNPIRLTIKGLQTNDFSRVIEVASQNCEKIEFNNIISDENNDTSLTFSLKVSSVNKLDDLIKTISDRFPNSSFSLIDIN
ncbi:DUF4956 domain-containing protein, partial [Prochlorococcus sp. AH-736-P13]